MRHSSAAHISAAHSSAAHSSAGQLLFLRGLPRVESHSEHSESDDRHSEASGLESHSEARHSESEYPQQCKTLLNHPNLSNAMLRQRGKMCCEAHKKEAGNGPWFFQGSPSLRKGPLTCRL